MATSCCSLMVPRSRGKRLREGVISKVTRTRIVDGRDDEACKIVHNCC